MRRGAQGSGEVVVCLLSCPKGPELKGDHLLALQKMSQNGKTKRSKGRLWTTELVNKLNMAYGVPSGWFRRCVRF